MTAIIENDTRIRRRGKDLDEAIREAVRDELTARGYADLTFEGVARRAQTSKPVIYRRYNSRAQMVLDAWIGPTPSDPAPPSTGSLREDLQVLGRTFSTRLERIGIDTIRGLLAEVQPEQLQGLTEATTSWARTGLIIALDAARERGELRTTPVPEHVAFLPIVLVRNELLLHTGSVGEAFGQGILDRLIDDICLPLLTGKFPT